MNDKIKILSGSSIFHHLSMDIRLRLDASIGTFIQIPRQVS